MSHLQAYKNLELYQRSKQLAIACYGLTQDLPEDEKTNFSRHIRMAALEVHVNIARIVFARKKKRKKFRRAAKNALIVIEAASDILVEVGFVTPEEAEVVNRLSASCHELLDQI